MWVGCYALDLYCDNIPDKSPIDQFHTTDSGLLVDDYGHWWNEFPHQYTGETGKECKDRAKAAGWANKVGLNAGEVYQSMTVVKCSSSDQLAISDVLVFSSEKAKMIGLMSL